MAIHHLKFVFGSWRSLTVGCWTDSHFWVILAVFEWCIGNFFMTKNFGKDPRFRRCFWCCCDPATGFSASSSCSSWWCARCCWNWATASWARRATNSLLIFWSLQARNLSVCLTAIRRMTHSQATKVVITASMRSNGGKMPLSFTSAAPVIFSPPLRFSHCFTASFIYTPNRP